MLVADPDAYVQRYGESDKAHTSLGEGRDAWPVPYWTVDASMAAMVILLAAEDEEPEMEFLEYLGLWEESDEEWLMVEQQLNAESEQRIDPVPEGEESMEDDDES